MNLWTKAACLGQTPFPTGGPWTIIWHLYIDRLAHYRIRFKSRFEGLKGRRVNCNAKVNNGNTWQHHGQLTEAYWSTDSLILFGYKSWFIFSSTHCSCGWCWCRWCWWWWWWGGGVPLRLTSTSLASVFGFCFSLLRWFYNYLIERCKDPHFKIYIVHSIHLNTLHTTKSLLFWKFYVENYCNWFWFRSNSNVIVFFGLILVWNTHSDFYQ